MMLSLPPKLCAFCPEKYFELPPPVSWTVAVMVCGAALLGCAVAVNWLPLDVTETVAGAVKSTTFGHVITVFAYASHPEACTCTAQLAGPSLVVVGPTFTDVLE